MKIKQLTLTDWRQFKNINIQFHQRLTILTGANGAGKTTILNTFNYHFGWDIPLISTPRQNRKTGTLNFFSGLRALFKDIDNSVVNNYVEVGQIHYDNDQICILSIPEIVSTTYQLNYSSQQPLIGIHIPSHRPVYKYNHISNISTTLISREQAFHQYNNAKSSRYRGGGGHSENFYIKETLISLATFGYGNQVVAKNYEAVALFEGFENILRKVLPPKLGFEKIAVRIPEVVLITKTGEFSLDAVSGGVASIIDLAWQLYMFKSPSENFVVTLDEPENHLHPEMQKTLLANFLNAFPHVQFVVATHSPFIITSVADSNVYALNYDKDGKVYSILLDNFEKSGTANEILREVLGIESTMPEWVDQKIESIIDKYATSGITPENLNSFKNDLKQVGLQKYVSVSVSQLIDKSK